MWSLKRGQRQSRESKSSRPEVSYTMQWVNRCHGHPQDQDEAWIAAAALSYSIARRRRLL